MVSRNRIAVQLDFWRYFYIPTTPYNTSEYKYDARDLLTDVWQETSNTPPDDVHTSIMYDHAGRKTQMTDPDMGTWLYGYDAAGNMKWQRDSRLNYTCFYYDELNRLTHRVKDVSSSCTVAKDDHFNGNYNYNLLARYYYDGEYPQNVGGWPTWATVPTPTGQTTGRLTAELWMAANPDNWRVYHYDARGRATREAVVLKQNGPYTTQYAYDVMDRIETMIYPDNEVLTYGYNAQGLPETLTSSTGGVYVASADYDELGRIRERVLGNGTYRTKYEYYGWTAAHGSNAGRLQIIQTGTSGNPGSLQRLTYTYDAVGNIKSVLDTRNSNQRQCFEYDHLDRLTHAFTGNASCTSYSATGNGPYDHSYAFTGGEGKLGNITSFNGSSYEYNSTQPHAVTHVAGVLKYQYDVAGNMTGWDGKTLSYDSQNRLRNVWENGQLKSEYEYDGNGARMYEYRAASNSASRYVGEHYEKYGPQSYKYKKYYAFGGKIIAMRDMASSSVIHWLLSDHLGSTTATVPTSGTVKREWYYPFGAERYNSGGTLPTTKKFTGQQQDTTTGLYWYRSRWYDPSLGRFLQPDTIVPNPGNPGSLNRYSYVLNNPLRYRDPSGHAPQYPGDPDPDNAPCSTSWCWQNRWYRAHGFDWNENTNHWSTPTAAIEFYDEGIAQEFFTEFDIALSGPWTLSQLNLVGQGMVDFYRKIGSAGRLVQLMGSGNRFIRSGNGAGPCSVTHAACTWFSTVWFYDELFTHSDSFVKGIVVHELAHVIDFNSVIPSHASRGEQDVWFSLSFAFPEIKTITEYGHSGRAEYWAEAVADWVYGSAYKGNEPGRRNIRALQVDLLNKWLGGR